MSNATVDTFALHVGAMVKVKICDNVIGCTIFGGMVTDNDGDDALCIEIDMRRIARKAVIEEMTRGTFTREGH